jgi:hypothetical protein
MHNVTRGGILTDVAKNARPRRGYPASVWSVDVEHDRPQVRAADVQQQTHTAVTSVPIRGHLKALIQI